MCCDETQSYYLHYYVGKDGFIVTPQGYHIAKTINGTVDDTLLYQKIATRCLPFNKTPFNGVYRLLSHQLLEINCSTANVILKDIGTNSYITRSDGLSKAVAYAIDFNVNKYSAFDSVGIFATGGLDSRCVIAANVASCGNKKFSILNWESADESIPAAAGDTEACLKLSSLLGVVLKTFDCTEPNFVTAIESRKKSDFTVFGELLAFHGGNVKYHEMLANADLPEFVEYGGGGEVANRLSRPGGYVQSIEKLVDFYINYTNSLAHKHIDPSHYLHLYSEEWKLRLKELGIEKEVLSEEDCTKAYNWFVLNENLDHVNVTNLFRYSAYMFADKKVFDSLTSTPMSEKINGHGSLYIVYQLCPQLLNVPIYSHRQNREIDMDNLQLIEVNQNETFKSSLKKIPMLQSCAELYHAYIPFDKKEADKENRKRLVKDCHDLGARCVKCNTFSEIPYLAECVTWLKIKNLISS